MRIRRRPDDRPPLSAADRMARGAWLMSALLALLIAAIAAAEWMPAKSPVRQRPINVPTTLHR